MEPNAENIALALNGKKVGKNWQCVCPAHDDSSPSLSVKQGHSTVLLKCRVGCSQKEVIQALSNLGLWSKKRIDNRGGGNKSFISKNDLFEIYLYVKISENEQFLTNSDRIKIGKAKKSLAENQYGLEQARQTLHRLTQSLLN